MLWNPSGASCALQWCGLPAAWRAACGPGGRGGNAKLSGRAHSRRGTLRRAGGGRGSADEEAGAGGDRRPGHCRPAGISRSPAMAGASSIAGSTGFGSSADAALLRELSQSAPALSRRRSWAAFVARNDMFIGGIDFIWSRIGGAESSETRQRALRRARRPHPRRGVHHRLRRRSRAARPAEPPSLWHGRRPQLLQPDQALDLSVPGQRLRTELRPNEGLGRSGRRLRRALSPSTTAGS